MTTKQNRAQDAQNLEQMKKLPLPKTLTRAEKRLIAEGKKNPNASKPAKNFLKNRD